MPFIGALRYPKSPDITGFGYFLATFWLCRGYGISEVVQTRLKGVRGLIGLDGIATFEWQWLVRKAFGLECAPMVRHFP